MLRCAQQVVLALLRALPSLERALPPPGEKTGRGNVANMAHPILWQCLQGCTPGQILIRSNIPRTSALRASDSRLFSTIMRSPNSKCRGCALRAFHDVTGPRMGIGQLANAFLKLLNDWCHPPGRRISWEDCEVYVPTHRRSWDWPQQTPAPKICPRQLTPGTGSISELWVAFLLGLLLWTSAITRRTLIIYPCNYLPSRFIRSHFQHSHWTKPSPRHHHLSPDSYTILLTGLPASTLDPKHQGSRGGCWFAKVPEKSSVIPMQMGYWDLSVSNSPSKRKKKW